MKFLSDEWFELVAAKGAELPEIAGATMVTQHVISASPDGKVQCSVEVVDGRVVAVAAGKRKDAGCTVTWTYEDALGALRGADLDTAFMRGQLKVEGDYRALLYDLGPVFGSPAGQQFLAAVTEPLED